MKQVIKLTESDLHKVIKESVKRLLKEWYGNDIVKFLLYSPMNGQLIVQVPYNELMRAKNKTDLLWDKCAEQNNVKLMYNGYFKVHPQDPHRAEIEKIMS